MLQPANIFYPVLMTVGAVLMIVGALGFHNWLALGLGADQALVHGRLIAVARAVILSCWLVCAFGVALHAIFPETPRVTARDIALQRIHDVGANSLFIFAPLGMVAYLLLWILSPTLRRVLTRRLVAIKASITVAAPALVVGLSFAALGFPCRGVAQWAVYFTFIAYFGSFSLELSLEWPTSSGAKPSELVASESSRGNHNACVPGPSI